MNYEKLMNHLGPCSIQGLIVRGTTRWVISLAVAALFLLQGGPSAVAQDVATGQGIISGRVYDSAGRIVPKASVTVRNVDTNVTWTATTNDTGYYEVRDLNPGPYEVLIEASTFEQLKQTGITLLAGQNPSLDATLKVGSANEVVTVTDGSPLLETQDVSVGQVYTAQEIDSLPNGVSSLWLAMLSPGVQTTLAQNYQLAGGDLSWNGAGSAFGAYGRIGANEFSLDGAPNMGNNRGQAINPTAEEVGQLGVNVTEFDASFGHTYGISVTQVTKAGTNDFHGAIRYRYDTARWFGMQHFQRFTYLYAYQRDGCSGNPTSATCKTDLIKYGWPGTHENVGDAGLSGPVFIPKIFDGRNKLFFFVGVAIGAPDNAKPNTANVPTTLERTGNFSDLPTSTAPTGWSTLCPSSPFYGQYQIYNPYSVTIGTNGVPSRQPFCGNIIPSNLISTSPMIQLVDSFLPNPTSSAVTGTNLNYVPVSYNTYREVTNRYDYAPGSSDHIFFRWTRAHYTLYKQGFTTINADALSTPRWITTAATGWSHVVSPKTVIEVNVGATQYTGGGSFYPGWDKYKPSDLGLPTYLDDYAGQFAQAPVLSLSGYSAIGASDISLIHWRTLAIRGNVTSVRGPHTFRLGGEWRQQNAAGGGPGNPSGTLNFDNTYVQQNNGTNNTYPTTSTALSFASFLLGIQTTASASTAVSYSRSTPYYGLYLADTWRVSRKLTIIPGVRYEFEYGPTEKHNQQIVGWDPNAQLSIAPAAEAAYQTVLANATAAQKTVLPATLKIQGGPIYAGVNGAPTRQWINNWRILPRIGVAYHVRPNTVIRAGYGLFYDTLDMLSDNGTIDNDGYSSTTGPVASSTTFGTNFSPTSSPLSDPFPLTNGSRFVSPVGNAVGADYYAGSSATIGIYDHDRVPARSERVQFSVDHQIGRSTAIQVAYLASRTTDITLDGGADNTNTHTVGYQLATAVPGQYFTGGTQPNTAMNSLLSSTVANPFYIGNLSSLATSNPAYYNILSKSSYVTSTTIQVANLLRPYPQMAALRFYHSNGSSQFQEGTATISQRLSGGLVANASFQKNYQKDRDYYANTFDPYPSLESSNNSTPWRMTASGVYTLPFGRGRRWAREGWKGLIAGGFVLSGSFEAQPGYLLTFPNLFYIGNPSQIQLRKESFNDNYSTGTAFIQGFNAQAANVTAATTVNGVTTCTYSGSGFVESSGAGGGAGSGSSGSACQPNAYNLRVFPTHIEGIRQMGLTNFNSTLSRVFHPQERLAFETRVDLLNVFNHQRVGAAQVNPTSTQFGQVSTDNGNGRTITFQVLLRY